MPLVLGAALFALMHTWKRGRDLLFSRFRQDSLPLKSFLARLPQSRTIRVPGIAIFMTGQADYVPGALLHNLKHNKVLHERVIFVTVLNEDIPQVGPDRRREVTELAPGIHRVILRYGFQESPHIPRELEGLKQDGVAYEAMQASYFLGRETLVAGDGAEDVALAAVAVHADGAQCRAGHRVLPHPVRPGGRARACGWRSEPRRPAALPGSSMVAGDGSGSMARGNRRGWETGCQW